MVLFVCQHCDYKWDYRGENEHYATCPRCRYKVRITEDKVQMLRQKRWTWSSASARSGLDTAVKEKPVKLIGIAGIVNRTIEDYQYDKSMLIQILLRLQKDFGWLPMEMLVEVSKQLGISINQAYQVASFYKAFSLSPRGRHLIRICSGTSCRVRGAPTILEKLQSLIGIAAGEVTPDGKFSLETVNCLGGCSLSPMMTIDGEYYGNLKLLALQKILSKYT